MGLSYIFELYAILNDHQMKLNLLVFISVLTTLVASCQTSSNNTLEEFKKIDSSLQKSNSTLVDNVYATMYGQIQMKKDKNQKRR